jgi:methionine-rich copper-binding protein CopC
MHLNGKMAALCLAACASQAGAAAPLTQQRPAAAKHAAHPAANEVSTRDLLLLGAGLILLLGRRRPENDTWQG